VRRPGGCSPAVPACRICRPLWGSRSNGFPLPAWPGAARCRRRRFPAGDPAPRRGIPLRRAGQARGPEGEGAESAVSFVAWMSLPFLLCRSLTPYIILEAGACANSGFLNNSDMMVPLFPGFPAFKQGVG